MIHKLFPPGNYRLTVTDSYGNSLLAEEYGESVTVADKSSISWDPWQSPRVNNIDDVPDCMVVGEKWTHVPDFYNDKTYENTTMEVSFFKPGSQTKRYVVRSGYIGNFWGGSFTVTPFVLDLPYGVYDVCYSIDCGQISPKKQIHVGEKVGDVYYYPIDDNTAAVCHDLQNEYSGHVDIPSTITVNGKNYTVKKVDDSAFSSNKSLESVKIPETVEKIGRNAFAYCPNLNNMFIASPDVPFTHRNYIMPGAAGTTDVYVPASAHENYNAVLGEKHNVYAMIESIGSLDYTLTKAEAVVEIPITPKHDAINGDFLIEPETETNPTSEVTSVEVADGALRIGLKALRDGENVYTITSAQPGVEPGKLSVKTIMDPTAIEVVESDSEEGVSRMYDLQGRPSTVRRGFRVIVTNGKAKVIKF